MGTNEQTHKVKHLHHTQPYYDDGTLLSVFGILVLSPELAAEYQLSPACLGHRGYWKSWKTGGKGVVFETRHRSGSLCEE